ncbi:MULTISPECIES: glycosyl hydrolase family 28-related protein [unclassified Streptomyces]|nr:MULTISPECIES: glycosyl hydrolase family 28-related protein [unclassified Streptomyces]
MPDHSVRRTTRLSRRGFVALGAAAAATPILAAPAATAFAGGWDPTRYGSVYTSQPADPTAVLLGSRNFETRGDGTGDDTAALQAAVDEASRRGIANKLGDILGGARDFPHGDGGGVVLVPSGTYRLSAPIQVHDSVRIIGYGPSRPSFVLGPSTPGYSSGAPRELFGFLRRPLGGPVSYANNDTFGTALINLNIRIGPGNPDAMGVRFGGAQLCLLQDLDIEVGDGLCGIDHNANLVHRVRIAGGQVGLRAWAASAGWQTTLLDCRFTGQSHAAVTMGNDAKLVVIRAVIAKTPRAFEAAPDQPQHLYVQDTHLDRVSDVAVTLNDSASLPGSENDLIRLSNQLTLLNCTTTSTPDLLLLTPSRTRTTAPAPNAHIRELTHGLRVESALTSDESRHEGVHLAATAGAGTSRIRSALRSDTPTPPPAKRWVSVTDVAKSLGRTIGQGEDDLAVFQTAVDQHDVVFVPIGRYLLTDTLKLRRTTQLIGLHPRQTWLLAADGHPNFSDPETPRALVATPKGGRNTITGIGLDTAQHTPGAVNLMWQSADGSYLADIATQFVKWHPEGAPEAGNPGYTYRGAHKYTIWVRGGGGTFANIWSGNGWAENGLLAEDTTEPARLYGLSVEHHETREVVLRRVSDWQFLGLQTEDHIHGWRSQAVEIERSRDLQFANSVFFRVATVLGPHPYSVGIRDSKRITLRGHRGFRDKTPEYTQWGAAVSDRHTGRTVPEVEYTLIRTR